MAFSPVLPLKWIPRKKSDQEKKWLHLISDVEIYCRSYMAVQWCPLGFPGGNSHTFSGIFFTFPFLNPEKSWAENQPNQLLEPRWLVVSAVTLWKWSIVENRKQFTSQDSGMGKRKKIPENRREFQPGNPNVHMPNPLLKSYILLLSSVSLPRALAHSLPLSPTPSLPSPEGPQCVLKSNSRTVLFTSCEAFTSYLNYTNLGFPYL